MGDLGKQRRPQASNEWGMVGSSKGWWESADGWRDEAGETEWCEGEALITRGGGDHAASLRNEFDDVKTEVKNMKEDIKGILPMFEKTMKVMEENLHLAKEEICGAKARMEMLEADIKKVVQTDDRGTPAVVTAPPQPAPVVRAPQSPVVTARESAPVERAPHSPALSAPESEPVVTEPCRWHKHKPDSCVELDCMGVEEKDVDDWINHLGSTLFKWDNKPACKILTRLRPVHKEQKCRVTACRTQANRSFHVQCLDCLQCVYGKYGTWAEGESPMAPTRAAKGLMDFFMIEESGEKPQT